MHAIDVTDQTDQIEHTPQNSIVHNHTKHGYAYFVTFSDTAGSISHSSVNAVATMPSGFRVICAAWDSQCAHKGFALSVEWTHI